MGYKVTTIEELNKMFEENYKCPKCKSYGAEHNPMVYDDGTLSEDTEECKCNNCGWQWYLV